MVNIFYSYHDFLVFYTIFAVCAKSSNVTVLELCLMYDHIHSLVITETMQELSRFYDRMTSWFVHEFNSSIGRKGKLFHKNFGSAPKWEDKAVRSTINYIGNNPVEKMLCTRAQDYRWNFLAYIADDNPFSERIITSKASRKLRNAVKEASMMAEMNLPLKYVHLKRMFKNLNEHETEQLIDHIIRIYNPFEQDELISYFGSFEKMMTAMNSNTGSEHDIKEDRDYSSHTVFLELIGLTKSLIPDQDIRKIIVLPEIEKRQLYSMLKHRSSAGHWQLCKFLHLNPSKA